MSFTLRIVAITAVCVVVCAAVPTATWAGPDDPKCEWGGTAPPEPATFPEFFEQPIYFDSLGLIVHRRPDDASCDPGDTAQREGWYWFGVHLRQQMGVPWTTERRLTFDDVMRLLDPDQNGQFRRHPMFSPNDLEWGLSRDQIEPLVAALGVWGKHEEIRRLWRALPQDTVGKWSLKGTWQNVFGLPPYDCSAIRTQPCPTIPCGVTPLLGVFAPAGAAPTIAPFSVVQPQATRGGRPPAAGDGTQQVPRPQSSSGPVKPPTAPGNFRVVSSETRLTSPQAITETISAASCAPPSVPVNCEPNFSCPSLLGVEEPLCAQGRRDAQQLCERLLDQGKQSYERACNTAQAGLKAGAEVVNVACQIEETRAKFECEAGKQLMASTCQGLNHYRGGDYIGPMTINLFIRALNGDALSLVTFPPLPVYNFEFGENELAYNLEERLNAHPNDVDKDLNLTVKAVMARLRLETPTVTAAIHDYATKRRRTYGSYLVSYYKRYGFDTTNMIERIEEGIRQGWEPDDGVSASFGALRWYHRKTGGANPSIVELYHPIVDAYIK